MAYERLFWRVEELVAATDVDDREATFEATRTTLRGAGDLTIITDEVRIGTRSKECVVRQRNGTGADGGEASATEVNVNSMSTQCRLS